MRILIAVVLLAACHKPSPNCQRGVHRVVELVSTAGPPGSEPKGDEKRAIDQIERGMVDQCDREGLSDAQRDCILAATSLTDRTFLTCPALVAKPPSWIVAPIGHPEAVEELQKMRNVQPPPVDVDDIK